MFGSAPDDVVHILATERVTANFHSYCTTQQVGLLFEMKRGDTKFELMTFSSLFLCFSLSFCCHNRMLPISNLKRNGKFCHGAKIWMASISCHPSSTNAIPFLVCNFIRRKWYMNGSETVIYHTHRMPLKRPSILPHSSWINHDRVWTSFRASTKRIAYLSIIGSQHSPDWLNPCSNKVIYLRATIIIDRRIRGTRTTVRWFTT